jgi:hypothetical protein
VPLANEICSIEAELDGGGAESAAWQDDATVFLGMYDHFGQQWPNTRAKAVALAFRQVNRYAGGLPPKNGESKNRPVGLITCDYGLDKDKGFAHLKELEIPAIIGPAHRFELVELANAHTMADGMLLIGTHTTLPPDKGIAATAIKDSGLLWHTAPDQRLLAPAMRALVKQFEATVRVELGLSPIPPPEYLRLGVAAVSTDATATAFVDGLTFNNGLSNAASVAGSGSPPLTPVDGGTTSSSTQEQFKMMKYEREPTSIHATVRPLADFGPHIVTVSGHVEAVHVVEQIETSWDNAKYSSHRPLYLLTDQARYHGGPSSNVSEAGRVRGVSFVSRTVNYPTFAGAYAREYGEHLSANDDSQFAYDAAWLLIYAYYAAGDLPRVAGRDIAQGIRRLLPDGPTTPKANVGSGVGGGAVTQTFGVLAAGSNVDLVGASGELDFNPTTGEVSAESTIIEVYCVANPSGPPTVPTFVSAGQTYNVTTNTFDGTFNGNGQCAD